MRSVKISKHIQADKILVSFSYDPEFVAKVKSIKGYRWHPDKKYWSFPYSKDTLKNILSIFENEDIDVDSILHISLSQKFEKQLSNQPQITEAVKKELKLRGYSQKQGKHIYIISSDTLVILPKVQKSLTKIISESICSI